MEIMMEMIHSTFLRCNFAAENAKCSLIILRRMTSFLKWALFQGNCEFSQVRDFPGKLQVFSRKIARLLSGKLRVFPKETESFLSGKLRVFPNCEFSQGKSNMLGNSSIWSISRVSLSISIYHMWHDMNK